MTRSHSRDPTPREHSLTETVRLLAAEIRVLREALDELVTELQWQNQNRSDRRGERGCPFAGPVRQSPVQTADAIETSKSGDPLLSLSSSDPSPPRRLDGRLF